MRYSSKVQLRWVTAAGLAAVLGGCGGTDEPGMNLNTITAGTGAPNVQGPGATAGMGSITQPTGGTTGGPGTGGPDVGSAGMAAPATMGIPCEVNNIVTSKCQGCHGATPIGGAPMSLITVDDFQRDYQVATTTQLAGQTMKVHQIARIRINAEMGTGRMPQGAPLPDTELAALDGWLAGGAQPGAACGSDGGPGTGGPGTAGTGGTSGTGGPADLIDDQCDEPGAFDPLVGSGDEVCYEFRVHGQTGLNDTSKFSIPPGETYNQFYYAVPWPAGSLSTRFGSDFDNLPVLHHWLAFAQTLGMAPGTVEPGVLGTTLFTDAELIAGWAVGGCTTTYPPDVGVKLPDSGVIMVQWHHYNSTGGLAQDSSAVQICAVPPGARPNVAGLTFLGTENLRIPGGSEGEASGTCVNDSGAPITIFGFNPHMHEIGINMKSEVTRASGGTEVVFDMPFQFDYQTNYMLNPPVVLQPGDSITSTCTWRNESASSVGFGQSTKQEMCYQFALSYPYNALNNGVVSLIGATNTCW